MIFKELRIVANVFRWGVPALTFFMLSCVLDYEPGGEDEGGGAKPHASSSSSPPPGSLSSATLSSSSTGSGSSGSLGGTLDTLPTWKVPFTESVSRVMINPVGSSPDMVLSSFGTKTVADFLTRSDWNVLFPNRAGVNRLCDASSDFYTYDAFVAALKDFPAFAAEGPDSVRKRELAAFLGQISHETSGGSGSFDAGSDRYNWGLCWTAEIDKSNSYIVSSTLWPAAPGKSYYGRGPLQLTWNYNYGLAGDDLGAPMLVNPDWVLETGTNAFRTALWFWMKEQTPKPSPHAAIVETWAPTAADKKNNRWPGYGVITNVINGGGECGDGSSTRTAPLSRMGYYARYAKYLKVGQGRNVDCYTQHDFRFQ